ncbi:MAG TPA: DinB family protein [Pyrinomonadaceae bacterium]|jgi:hypothetical protein
MKKSDINPMPQYFDRYINLVADVELSQAFDDSFRQIEKLDTDLLAKIGGKTYASGKWTIKDIFQHIVDFERILTYRALLFARQNPEAPKGIDEQLFASNANTEKRAIGALIEELKIVRTATKSLYSTFDDETLLKTGLNWKYEISVLAMGFNIVAHQIHHFKIIEEKYYPLVGKNQDF